MTSQPRPTPPVIATDLRQSARRQARGLSGGLIAAAAGVAAMVVVVGFVLLDYRFNQDSSRLIKIAAGIPAVLFIVLQPRIGLALLPVAAPFLAWLPQLPIPGLNTLNALLLSVFGMWAMGRILAQQTIGRPVRLGQPIALMFGMMVLSWIRGAAIPSGYTYDAGANAVDLFRTATTFAPYFITLLMLRGEKDRTALLVATMLGLLAESIVTIWFGNWMKTRAMGSMAQPNVLGAFLVISTVMAVALLLGQRRWLPRIALLAVVGFGAYATLLTISRGAMIALSLGVLYVSVRSSRVVTVLILAAILTSPVWAPDTVKDRVMATTRSVEDTDDTELEGSAQARLDTWNATVQVASEHLFDGVGYGGLGYVLRDTGTKLGLGHTKDSTHNTFLRMLGEMGIFGLLIYLFLLWKLWSLAQAGVRAARTRLDRQVAVGMGGATIAIVVNCWFGDRFFAFDIMCAYWMFAALVNDILLRASEASP